MHVDAFLLGLLVAMLTVAAGRWSLRWWPSAAAQQAAPPPIVHALDGEMSAISSDRNGRFNNCTALANALNGYRNVGVSVCGVVFEPTYEPQKVTCPDCLTIRGRS